MIRWLAIVVFLGMALINAYAQGRAETWSPEFFVMMANSVLWCMAMWSMIDDIRHARRERYQLPKNRNVKLRK